MMLLVNLLRRALETINVFNVVYSGGETFSTHEIVVMVEQRYNIQALRTILLIYVLKLNPF